MAGFGKAKGKKGKKAGRKAVDAFAKKEWYNIRAPAVFTDRDAGVTCVNRTQGTRIASDSLKGRVFEINLADLQNDEEVGFRKMLLRCDDVRGDDVLTNFHGMEMTSEKKYSLVRKWQTMVENSIDIRTIEGYVFRVFSVAFTKKKYGQAKRNCYAQTAQVKQIRRKMTEVLEKECRDCTISKFFEKVMQESISKDIEKSCSAIFPLQNCYVTRVKLVRAPKVNLNLITDIHTDKKVDAGKKVEKVAPSSIDA
ncbi:Ribosomal protein S3Ae [Carpediemonas membranifera]|uniref:Small ribosomal subunit protein eS1 n=1 Tax=Carpediemonas membranifera TaxID=201153 RepID=A0A8J6AQR4_9EUKA|nr:Ribosomal protein S3Ae [Carpediemonas membranifera]KAG9391787.1 Ribosomal protein S3Ae [Carpediemonas membranifera]|eukprot:KAG9391786.1 Ribosomal protein S3Ae [Carpediemonas membranifera]